MEILVTGGCGFIGSHTVDGLLAEGHAVTVLDNLSSGNREQLNPAARLVVGDVADAEQVATLVAKADAVVHLAAVASVDACTHDWLNAHRTNLTGTVTVLNAARKNKTRVIYASSAAVYGDNPALPLAETALPQPLSAYGLDKLGGEQQAAIGWKFHGIPSVGMRFFNVYGPRQNPASPYSGVISKFMALARENAPLTFFGDGEQTRDFIYVGDVVRLIRAALTIDTGAQVVNGCTGTATSLKQLAATIGTTIGQPIRTHHAAAKAGDIRHSRGAPEYAMHLLQFQAETDLAAGLRLLADHA